MTPEELKLIKNFIDKKEPKRMEFEEAQAIVKMLFIVYERGIKI